MEIHDLVLHKISWNDYTQLTIVQKTDPLLRRFGQCDLVMLNLNQSVEIYRKKADEIWAVGLGEVEFDLIDDRSDSPTYQAEDLVMIKGGMPTSVLIPFGVICRITGKAESSVLVRLTTHQDGTHQGDKTLNHQVQENF